MYPHTHTAAYSLLLLFAFFPSTLFSNSLEFHLVMCFSVGYRWQQALSYYCYTVTTTACDRNEKNRPSEIGHIVCVMCECGAPLIILVTLDDDDANGIYSRINVFCQKGAEEQKQKKKTVGSTVYGWQYDWIYDAKMKLMNGMPFCLLYYQKNTCIHIYLI